MRHVHAVALLSVIAAGVPSTSLAQWRAAHTWSVETQAEPAAASSAFGPALLSLALPGAGQHVLEQDRKWLYVAVEVAGWIFWAERRSSAADYGEQYRDYAWETARLQSDPRVDGDFDYYERMSKWSESGAFDADPASSGVQPELDDHTYNGSVWSLASRIHLPPGDPPPVTDPAYQAALGYYVDRAYGSTFLWDWSGAPGGQQELARLIEESDSRYGQATTALGVVIANHMLSAVDAYLSARGRPSGARLRVIPAGGGSLTGHAFGRSRAGTVDWTAPVRPAADWLLVLTVGVGR